MSLYEGGIRVPALLHWPSRLEGGRSLSTFATVYDWLPTLASLAGHPGVEDSDLAGIDLWPTIEHSAHTPARPGHCHYLRHAAGPRMAVIEGGWKLIRSLRPAPDTPGQYSVELFNVLDDPYETNDLAASEPERTARLLAYTDTITVAPVLGATPPLKTTTAPPVRRSSRTIVPPIYTPVAESVTDRPPGPIAAVIGRRDCSTPEKSFNQVPGKGPNPEDVTMRKLAATTTLVIIGISSVAIYAQQGRMAQIVAPKATLHKASEIDEINVNDLIQQSLYGRRPLRCLRRDCKRARCRPHHNHPEEEVIVVITGRLRAMTPDGDAILEPGDVIVVESYAEHQFEALEDTYMVEAFGPGRVIGGGG